jgi:transposase
MHVTTIGVDLAKHVFQLHGVGPDGQVIVRQRVRRPQLLDFFAKLPPCLVGMEACGTSHPLPTRRSGSVPLRGPDQQLCC